ncbi:hypothetical protein F4703DRAFT_1899535 [Phycomyces blakesleeanus]
MKFLYNMVQFLVGLVVYTLQLSEIKAMAKNWSLLANKPGKLTISRTTTHQAHIHYTFVQCKPTNRCTTRI